MPSLDILSTREAADALNISARDVQRLVVGGRLVPATKMPGKTGAYLFERADVEALRQESSK